MKNKHKFIDQKGINWAEFTCSYTHELDGRKFVFSVWAVDRADAVERLKFIGSNGMVDGELEEEIDIK